MGESVSFLIPTETCYIFNGTTRSPHTLHYSMKNLTDSSFARKKGINVSINNLFLSLIKWLNLCAQNCAFM